MNIAGSVKINSTYSFCCKMCGDCCSGNTQVQLNLYDLYKVALYLEYNNTKELLTNKIIRIRTGQNNIKFPFIRFNNVRNSCCPFLLNILDDSFKVHGSCKLHQNQKPLICKMSPVSRFIDLEKEIIEYYFILPSTICKGHNTKKQYKISDLINKNQKDLDYEYRFYSILDKIMEKKTKINLITHLYSFPTNKPFIKILEEFEAELG